MNENSKVLRNKNCKNERIKKCRSSVLSLKYLEIYWNKPFTLSNNV